MSKVTPELVEQVKAALPHALESAASASHGKGKLGAINWMSLLASVTASLPEALKTLEGLGLLSGTPDAIAKAVVSLIGVFASHGVLSAPTV